MRKMLFPFITPIFLWSGTFASATWPNEPAGATVALDCPFSGNVCTMQNYYHSAVFASPGGAGNPLSAPQALDSYMAANSGFGNGQWGYLLPRVREIYVGFWWSTNSEFQGMSNGSNKVFFVQGDDNNNLISWMGGQDQPRQLRILLQQTTMNNCHNPSWVSPGCNLGPEWGPGSGSFNPNGPSSGIVAAGSGWHLVETYQKASTSGTSRDGIIRLWLDRALVGNYEGVNVAPGGFTDTQINHAWDGSAGIRGTSDPSRPWHHYFDHLHISVPNCGAGGCPAPAYLMITSSLSPTRTGTPYTATLSADGGAKPYGWFLDSGKLPAGLSLNQNTGVISGTPTCAGRSDFTIRVTDGSQPALTATKSYSIITSGTCTSALNSNIRQNREAAAFRVKAASGRMMFNLPVASAAQYRISVYDLAGKKVYEFRSTRQGEISIAKDLKNGVYLAKFFQGAQSIAVRFQVMN